MSFTYNIFIKNNRKICFNSITMHNISITLKFVKIAQIFINWMSITRTYKKKERKLSYWMFVFVSYRNKKDINISNIDVWID